MSENKISGYKGFSHDMMCLGKQYAENTEFAEDKVNMCAKGMHFCRHPLDVLRYYNLLSEDAEPNVFARVDGYECDEGNDKCVTGRLIIHDVITFKDLVLAEIDASSGDCSRLAASGDSSRLASSGDFSRLAASGYSSRLAASGYSSRLAASGDDSRLAASGDSSRLASSGDSSRLAASGYSSRLAASGDDSRLAASGNYSVVAAIGSGGEAKASVGSWITLAEWRDGKPVCVKTEYVDGDHIKADTWYKLYNGNFVEAV